VICLQENASTGALEAVPVQPSDLSSCGLVAGSFSEFSSPSIFEIDAAAGAQIGAAIVLVWSIGLVFRLIVRALSVDSSSGENHETV